MTSQLLLLQQLQLGRLPFATITGMQMLGIMAIFPRVGIVEQLEFKFTSNQK